jgi:hypothetical protein
LGSNLEEEFSFEKPISISIISQCRKSSLQSFQMFESKVPKRIFGSKGEEVTGRWGKLHSVELHNLYTSPNMLKYRKYI